MGNEVAAVAFDVKSWIIGYVLGLAGEPLPLESQSRKEGDALWSESL